MSQSAEACSDAYFGDEFGVGNTAVIQQAFADLRLEYLDEPELFNEFLSLIQDHGGDISQITAKTHIPVSITEFLEDDYFLGSLHNTLWPEVRSELVEVIEEGYVEALLTGAIGIGKTVRAALINIYHLYQLSCERHPQARFGLMPTSDIRFAMMNKTDYLAKSVTYSHFRSLVESSPYFNEHFRHSAMMENKMVFTNHIEVLYAAANSDKVLGMNVIGGIVDEMNFMNVVQQSKQSRDGGLYDQAQDIYTALVRRIKSRFDTTSREHIGCLCLVSSKDNDDDFTSRRIRALEEEGDETTFISNKTQWDMMPEYRAGGRKRFCGETFTVAVGSRTKNSEVIVEPLDPEDERDTLEVPIEYEKEFRDDIEGSLRDFAGCSALGSLSYMTNVECLHTSTEQFDDRERHRIFLDDEWDLSRGIPTVNPRWRLDNKHCPRGVHIDLSLSGDGCGFALGHSVTDKKRRVRSRSVKRFETEQAPVVTYDDLLCIRPPRNGEIEFEHVRKLIYFLKDELRIPIKWVSYDNYQSVDSRQILAKRGFETHHISVEGNEAYDALKDAFTGFRVITPFHELCFHELQTLIQDPKTKRVDHPSNSSKDVADAMCGVYSLLMRKYNEGVLYRTASVMSGVYQEHGLEKANRELNRLPVAQQAYREEKARQRQVNRPRSNNPFLR